MSCLFYCNKLKAPSSKSTVGCAKRHWCNYSSSSRHSLTTTTMDLVPQLHKKPFYIVSRYRLHTTLHVQNLKSICLLQMRHWTFGHTWLLPFASCCLKTVESRGRTSIMDKLDPFFIANIEAVFIFSTTYYTIYVSLNAMMTQTSGYLWTCWTRNLVFAVTILLLSTMGYVMSLFFFWVAFIVAFI